MRRIALAATINVFLSNSGHTQAGLPECTLLSVAGKFESPSCLHVLNIPLSMRCSIALPTVLLKIVF